ncbi:hypothetical protein OESDEN_02429 [Oesophagostomum dentatum]|uniref:Uncharacterized protein n=1 Tax=Oesophagostomum dentatum TaxID=61180 RepID=A0A0B1TQD9_OESDE|nr:hypothetical protein OESDEN_02429 [Oesophagostomum dentatum]
MVMFHFEQEAHTTKDVDIKIRHFGTGGLPGAALDDNCKHGYRSGCIAGRNCLFLLWRNKQNCTKRKMVL